jgi:hypothetical protein
MKALPQHALAITEPYRAVAIDVAALEANPRLPDGSPYPPRSRRREWQDRSARSADAAAERLTPISSSHCPAHD